VTLSAGCGNAKHGSNSTSTIRKTKQLLLYK
jgi:hypothetical protein